MAKPVSQAEERTVQVVAGVDLGGTAINYTLLNQQEKFLIEGLFEHPALARQGPDICLQQIADGLKLAAARAGVTLDDVVAVGLDTPGPASAAGQLSARGSTNFVHPRWAGFDIRFAGWASWVSRGPGGSRGFLRGNGVREREMQEM